MRNKNLIALVLVYSILVNIFAPLVYGQDRILTNAPQNNKNDSEAEKRGLQFRLREDESQTGQRESSNVTATQKLTEAESNSIFKRLPPLKISESDKADFSLRPDSLPPPKTGNIISAKFPADERETPPDIKNADSTTLEVVRFSPEGKVPLAPDLTVTFSQPMTAVASQEQASETVPVILTPETKGKWHWLGTKTLTFAPDKRLPMATQFTAVIPAGTKSATGSSLPKDFSWTFSTPPPNVKIFTPNGETVRRDALLLAVFDQEIKVADVLRKISVTTVSNERKIDLRLASEDEIKADNNISEKIKDLLPNRYIVFRAADPLPQDSTVSLVFGKETPSAEGSLTTEAPQNYSFRTYGALKVEKASCNSYGETSCQPGNNFEIKFNNSLDKEKFDKSNVKITPKIEGENISFYEDTLVIGGYKNPRTTYKITIKKSIEDEFGQTLGENFSTEIKVDSMEPELRGDGTGKDYTILDPNAQEPSFSVYSVNYSSLKVKLYAVKAEDYQTFQNFREQYQTVPPTLGKLVFDRSIAVKAGHDETAETRIDISPALSGKFGHAVLIVETPDKEKHDQPVIEWLEATQIGIDAFVDDKKLIAFASDLKNGKPLNNVRISLSGKTDTVTGENGLANFELPAKIDGERSLLIARSGADSAILPEGNNYNDVSQWTRQPSAESLRWSVFDDRKMYRPGETVSVKGYLRRFTSGDFPDIGELGNSVDNLNYVLKDSRGNEIAKGTANLNSFGAFDLKLKLPKTVNLGEQKLELIADGKLEEKEYTHNFEVEEFRRPEFEVSARVEMPAPFYVGDSAKIGVSAKYYSGGFLSNAETNWKITAKPVRYSPPNRDDYTFGKFVPWWRDEYEGNYDLETSQELKGKTDSNGNHTVALDFVAANPSRPYVLNAEAKVQDVNRQTFAATATLLVHPAELYVGLKTSKNFVQANERFNIETITTDVDGKAIAGAPVSIVAELKDWQQIKGEWQEVTIDTQTCRIESKNEAVPCVLSAKRGGNFEIKASVTDRRARRNESELKVWVAGGHSEPQREVEKEEAELIPDKKNYTPNETAEILVNSPFFPAEGILTLRRGSIVKTERFTMNAPSTVLRIPIEERYLPNIYAQVNLVGAEPRIYYDEPEKDAKLPKRPAFAAGALKLEVSTASRNLNVTAQPLAKTLEPGGKTSIDIAVKDNRGNAVADSEIAVVAVDESVLALTNYKITNPLDDFYTEFEDETKDYYSRENVLLARPDDGAVGFGFGNGSGSGNGMGNGGGGGGGGRTIYDDSEILKIDDESPKIPETESNDSLIKIRKNFDALAIFAPSVKTDANGKAQVNLKLPDNLTRYRITAVAVTHSKQFGTGESSVTARQPLRVRPSAPRFMNFGDKIELPVVVQNQTDEALTVDVAVRAANANLTDGNGRRLTIPANDRAEILFPVSADKAGTAHFQFGAVSGKYADAAEIELPVYTPATTEAFATYGTTDGNGAIVQPISAPKDVFEQFGGLEVTTSSTQLQELTDAFIYLQNYPYECTEQISSRIISVAALRDVLTAFEAKDLPSKPEIEKKMKSDIERLQKLQHADGGFSFWRSDDASLPYVSAHVAHAFARAAQKNYAVPKEVTDKSLVYLKNIESKYPSYYSRESAWAISAYALYVRDLLGDKDAAKARNLLQEATLEKLSPESIGWLLSVLADDKDSAVQVEQIKRHLLNRVTETAGSAHFVTNYTDGEYVLLSSERRADGVILESLLKAEPDSDLIPKIVRGLLANKIKGRWSNTQENAFILLALDQYFQTYEKTTPDFAARLWLGQAFAGEQKFAGRSTGSNSIEIPMNYIQRQKKAENLILDKQGAGRLYYRIGLKYAPVNLKQDAADYGFTVTRTYEAVDDPSDVRQNAEGNWTFKSGARIRVKLQMVAPTTRYHVALVDYLPAGIEIINSKLAVSESSVKPPPFGSSYINRDNWFENQNLRDNRAEAFTTLLSGGVWNYSYLARATTPGNFIAPPAKAEEMYSPEVFGRSNSIFVKVE